MEKEIKGPGDAPKPKKVKGPGSNLTPKEVAEAFLPVEEYVAAKEVKGFWKDVVEKKRPDGTEEVVEDSDWNSNLIVVGMGVILAGLLKNDPDFAGGIVRHAIGRGSPAWDIPGPPTPNYSATSLVDEYFRKAPTAISYLDPGGTPVVGPTRSILVQTVLDYGEANGGGGEYIREQGLFGHLADDTLGSGMLMNLIYHVAKFKNSGIKITRYINLQF